MVDDGLWTEPPAWSWWTMRRARPAHGYRPRYPPELPAFPRIGGSIRSGATWQCTAFTYRDEPIIRMTNTFIRPAKIVRQDDSGDRRRVPLKELGQGGQADATAEFMFGVAEAYRITGGKVEKWSKGHHLRPGIRCPKERRRSIFRLRHAGGGRTLRQVPAGQDRRWRALPALPCHCRRTP